ARLPDDAFGLAGERDPRGPHGGRYPELDVVRLAAKMEPRAGADEVPGPARVRELVHPPPRIGRAEVERDDGPSPGVERQHVERRRPAEARRPLHRLP